MSGWVGAVDLGGTKLAVGLYPPGATEPAAHHHWPVDPLGGGANALTLAGEALAAMAQAQGQPLQAVGIASAGPLDLERGALRNPPNLPGWTGLPLVAPLEAALGVPAALANDADAAALAEAAWGSGQGAATMLYVTWSTGVGGGWVLKGEGHGGWRGLAGELGHLCVQPGGAACPCGKRGCLEAEASGSALARQAQALAHGGASPSLAALLAAGEALHAGHLFAAAEAGDAAAAAAVMAAIAKMAQALSGAIHLMAPDRVVMGGGLLAQGEGLLGPLREALGPWVAYLGWPTEALVGARFTADAPLLGAAELARRLP